MRNRPRINSDTKCSNLPQTEPHVLQLLDSNKAQGVMGAGAGVVACVGAVGAGTAAGAVGAARAVGARG